ncbi:MAG: polynucleotide adenylyltransferase PcnB [Pseudomonadota bacterium]|nr:polynucleotide adenylyltransferase PcnB [Pseudomonadota bacterium]
MKPEVYDARELGISRRRISRGAVRVVEEIQQAGFEAWLVGGCVRDLLMGIEPKDFDVTTNAYPEEIQEVFRRARLIGRRFRLAHVRMGREVIEVATYRANPLDYADAPHQVTTEHGRILSDNVYGDIEEDAARRDFTVNALYYDPVHEEVVDYLGGVRDSEAGLLRVIGDAERRFAEDPVRMLRVLRFRAKLGFDLEPDILDKIEHCAPLLEHVPPARMFDEVFKLFHHAHAVESWEELKQHGLLEHLLPQTADAINDPDSGEQAEQMIRLALESTDRRVREGKPVIPAFFFAVTLWRPFQKELREQLGKGLHGSEAVWKAGERVVRRQTSRIAIPKRVSVPAIEIWEMQQRLEQRRPRTVRRMLDKQRFRAAYDFLLMRSKAGEVPTELAQWWTRIQEVDEVERQRMIGALQGGGDGGHRRKRRRPRKRSPSNVAT